MSGSTLLLENLRWQSLHHQRCTFLKWPYLVTFLELQNLHLTMGDVSYPFSHLSMTLFIVMVVRSMVPTFFRSIKVHNINLLLDVETEIVLGDGEVKFKRQRQSTLAFSLA